MTIPLSNGQFAVVDDCDYAWLSQYKWYAQWNAHTKSYYAQRRITLDGGVRRKIWMHREILGLSWRDGRIGDHKDRDTLNNTRSNLREATPQQNAMNRKVRRESKTGIRGTCKTKYGGFGACITVGQVDKWLGTFATLEEAASAYAEAAQELHGEFRRTQ